MFTLRYVIQDTRKDMLKKLPEKVTQKSPFHLFNYSFIKYITSEREKTNSSDSIDWNKTFPQSMAIGNCT